MREKDNGMRLTSTRSRKTKNGTAFSTIHNDRNFDTENAPHIDPEKSSGNTYWHCFMDTVPSLTFEEVEEKFYQDFLSAGQEAKNQRYIKSGHREDCRTLEQLRREIAPPEEMVFQIGRASEGVGQPSVEVSNEVWSRYKAWHEKKYPQIKFLDDATHVDEFSIHKHSRQVYCAVDKFGYLIPNIEKCLEQMGVPRPFPSKKRTQYNNRKMTYTKDCRDKLFEICKEMGLELITEPQEKGRSGRSIDEIRTEGLQKDLQEAQQKAEAAQKELKELILDVRNAKGDLAILGTKKKNAEMILKSEENKIEKAKQELSDLLNQLKDAKKITNFYATPDGKAAHDFLMEYHPEILIEFYEEQDRLHEQNQKTVQESLEKLNNAPKTDAWTPPAQKKAEKKEKGKTYKDLWTVDPDMDF